MAKKERISAQEVLETISGFLELLDEEKLQKLDKLDSLDDMSSIKTKQDALEAKLTAVDQKMSEFVKPEDFEQKIKKRDEAFNKAIRGVPTEVKVKNDPVCLAQEDQDMLDSLKSQLDKRNQRFSVFSQIISGNKIWFLYLILTAVLSIGITILIMKNSVNEWAHRAMIAAIDMNEENPIGIYLTCRAEMPHNRKEYKKKVKAMEYDAKKVLYLAQRKISVVLHFSPHQHKAGGASPLGVARAGCFEQLAGVFASCGALHYAKILISLKIKNGISLTPLNCALNAFTFALNDSADAFVERLSK